MKRTIFILFWLLGSAKLVASEYTRTFVLSSPVNICTITQMKIDGKCVMATNYHCNEDISQNATIHEATRPNMSIPGARHSVNLESVIAANEEMDVIFYEVPTSLQGNCENLKESPSQQLEDLLLSETNQCKIRTHGHSRDGNIIREKNELVQYENSETTIYSIAESTTRRTTIDHKEWEVYPARAYLGMSGGIVTACEDQRPLGLLNGTYIGPNKNSFVPISTLSEILATEEITLLPEQRYLPYDSYEGRTETGGAKSDPGGARSDSGGARSDPGGAKSDPGGARSDSGGAKSPPGLPLFEGRAALSLENLNGVCSHEYDLFADPALRLPF